MKANELRIGNLIEHSGIGTLVIFGINADTEEVLTDYELRAQGDWWGIENFNPIPLTEEWLLKFGFEKESTNDCYVFKILIPHAKLVFAGLKKNSGFSLQEIHASDNDGEYNIIVSINRIEYIHQLQNLYFALTGEELTVKEKV